MMKKLVTTGIDPVAVEISPDSVIIYHQDMKIIKEEADIMIVQQVADVRPTKALIVVDDTDVFCVVSSFLLQRKHTSTSLIFCHNHINGFTHSWLPLLISIVIYQIFYQHLG